MKTHKLKTEDALFDAVKRGVKNFDVRKDDRHYQTGDIVELWRGIEHIPGEPNNSSMPVPAWAAPPGMPERERMKLTITFVLRGGQFGVDAGYVVLSLKPLEETPS